MIFCAVRGDVLAVKSGGKIKLALRGQARFCPDRAEGERP